MSAPQYRIRRVYINAGAAENILTPEQIAASEPKVADSGYTPLGREPQTPEEMVEYLKAKNAGIPVVAQPRVAAVAARPDKGHFTMPKNRPDWVKKHHDEHAKHREARMAARATAAPRTNRPIMKVKAPDGKVHTGPSLQTVAKSIVGVVKKAVVPNPAPVVKPAPAPAAKPAAKPPVKPVAKPVKKSGRK